MSGTVSWFHTTPLPIGPAGPDLAIPVTLGRTLCGHTNVSSTLSIVFTSLKTCLLLSRVRGKIHQFQLSFTPTTEGAHSPTLRLLRLTVPTHPPCYSHDWGCPSTHLVTPTTNGAHPPTMRLPLLTVPTYPTYNYHYWRHKLTNPPCDSYY